MLTVEHTDLQAAYDPTNLLSLLVFDVNHTAAYKSNEVILVVAEVAKRILPAGTPFGAEGTPMWILPQSQTNLLYLGTAAEPPEAGRPGVPSGVFTENLNLRLVSVDGPGNFFLWQASQFGGFNIAMNSADGITDADAHTVIIGSHEHFNFGFTTNGVYNIGFQLSGQRVGDSTNMLSPITPITFNVLPLPTNTPPAKIQLTGPKLATDHAFTFNVVGASGSIDVQGSEDLNRWTSTLTNVTVTTSPQAIVIPADLTKTHRFFRTLVRRE
jgi:hypothetical protein